MEHIFISNEDTAVVKTKQGKVRGYVYDNIVTFKGIPYAKARRFHAPEPAEPWEGILDATSYGYVCPLLELPKPGGELLVPHRYWVMNEDCQNLNIWTPFCDDKKRPVMVWLHGGGYEAGSAIEQIAYEGENMSRLGDVVVVSINHRLNILGYFDLSDFGEEYENSGNAGTDDIIAALRWIHENIALFGGDPDNVTVFGQSGGGAKITTLLQSPAADGLYAKGINMSGVVGTLLSDSTGSGKDLAHALMKELGIGSVKEMETISYEKLAKAYLKVKPELIKEGRNVGCSPHPNRFYKGDPCVCGFREETADIPLLVGTVFGEFTSFIPFKYDRNKMTYEEGKEKVKEELGDKASEKLLPLFSDAYPERNPVDLLNLDILFRLPAQEYIRKRSALNNCTYAYLFNLDLPVDGGRTPWHCADIPYVFHNTELVPVTQQAGMTEKTEKRIFDTVMAFAHTGDPNNESIPYWPASTQEEEKTLVISSDVCVKNNYDAELVAAVADFSSRSMQVNIENIQH